MPLDVPVVAVLLAGGTGTRLYPASRADRPKQFLALGGDRSLLRRTADRAAFADRLFAVAPARYATDVRDEVPEATVLVEPKAKDTGPALVYAAHRIRERVGDCVLLCLPTDHHVSGDFGPTARRAARVAAETGGLVTVGVEPTRPATGYGYVEPAPDHDADADRDGYAPVARFREKPDAETAAELVEAGCYWNAGTFAWTPDALLGAARDSPLRPLVEALDAGDPDGGFEAVPSVSVDYAVMEDAGRVFVVPAAFGWDDLGAWDALARILDECGADEDERGDNDERGDDDPGATDDGGTVDSDGNAILGNALAIDASGNVLASDDKHVSVVGVDDHVVAAFDDRVLVVPTDEAQRVREVVAALRDEGLF